MDGLETCRLLRDNESTRPLPILFLSAYFNRELAGEAQRLGALDFLAKPVSAGELRLKTNAIARLGYVEEAHRMQAYVLALAEEAEKERRENAPASNRAYFRSTGA
jgi:putative two-component system response regulator